MKPVRNFILVDDGAGCDVTPQVLATIASSIQAQVTLDFAAYWGHSGVTVITGPAPTAKSDLIPVYIRASSDVPGAAGYHDDDGVYVFRDGLPDLLRGPFSLSVVVSHEILECLGDPGANRWADVGDGKEVALELCDAVESYSYDMGAGCDVSDFVLPSFFDPTGVAPFSWLGKPTAPMTAVTNGGADYQIVRCSGAGETQVTASLLGHPRRSAKLHPLSRTSRRGYRAKDAGDTQPAPAQP